MKANEIEGEAVEGEWACLREAARCLGRRARRVRVGVGDGLARFLRGLVETSVGLIELLLQRAQLPLASAQLTKRSLR